MAYGYNVFISYKRLPVWENFLVRVLLPALFDALDEKMPPDARVFYDAKQEERPGEWPTSLAIAASRSRVIVPLLTNRYFFSDWCTAELAHFTAREEACGLNTPLRPGGLVFPVLISGGEYYPAEIRAYPALDLCKFATPYLNDESPNASEFYRLISNWASNVARAARSAPAHDDAWTALAWQRFQETFKKTAPPIEKPDLGAA